jgi:hypothetical protein
MCISDASPQPQRRWRGEPPRLRRRLDSRKERSYTPSPTLIPIVNGGAERNHNGREVATLLPQARLQPPRRRRGRGVYLRGRRRGPWKRSSAAARRRVADVAVVDDAAAHHERRRHEALVVLLLLLLLAGAQR